jgi:hypothetical protein
MSHSKHRRRALSLGLFAALSLMAFLAASAQAQFGWLLGEKKFITADTGVHAVIHPLADTGKKHALLHTVVGALNVLILCETLVTDDGLLFGTDAALREKAEGLIILLYTKCVTFLNEKESPPCHPAEPIEAKTQFHAILHTSKEEKDKGDGKTYILFEGEKNKEGKLEPFTTLKFSEECAIGEESKITGEVVAECLNEKLEKNSALTDYCLEDLVHHLIQEAPHKLFLLEGTKPAEEKYDELLFEGKLASLLGISDVLLSEEKDKGLTWGVHI